jgi:omega-3 fatty acid desaturase (delta-15 desaturase)
MSSTLTQTKQAPVVSSGKPDAAAQQPPFTLTSLRESIPKHCFEKNLWTSIYYMLRDFAFIGACYAVYPYINAAGGAYNPYGLTKFLWWNVVGFFGWCLFVVGHDCGHRTFTESVMLCDIFGHICHAPLLVPFHGWRVSHRKHHENHNHVEHDHSWRPVPKHLYVKYEGISKFLRFSYALLVLYPIYLLADTDFTSGNHFNPYSRLFSKEERVGSFISTFCVVAWLTFLFVTFPVMTLLDAYFMPYLFFVMWLDLVTYLHHTDSTMTYYRDNAWSFLKGGLSTVDRSYGAVIDHLHHDIGTHMIHHLFFTKIPHYHLLDATEALKPILGEHYVMDTTPIVSAFMKSAEACHYVDDKGTVLKYHARAEITPEEWRAAEEELKKGQ